MRGDLSPGMKVLFLVPYPLRQAASQRFRFEQYFPQMEKRGIHYSVKSFLTAGNWQIFFRKGRIGSKLMALLGGFAGRFFMLFEASHFDHIFIHRELTPIGPPVFEWILAKVLKKKIIYDFDDAIWLSDEFESALVRSFKWRSKVGQICRWSYKVSCGNAYLANYAMNFNKNTIVNPTTIDTEHRHNPDLFDVVRKDNIVTIGWTGSHSTLKYLQHIEDVLATIMGIFPYVKFTVIADRRPKFKQLPYDFVPWNEASEIIDLLKFDIGIMPLPDDRWAKGKCGFKLLQYMSLRIPSVASPVGVNTSIINNGTDGYLASTQESWKISLEQLITDEALRKEMGAKGRSKVVDNYSVASNSSTFFSLFV